MIDKQLRCLDRLADIGMNMAEDVDREVTAAREPDDPKPDKARLALTYERASRAVHLAFLVQARLLAELQKLQTAPGAKPPMQVQILRFSDEENQAAIRPLARADLVRDTVRRVAQVNGRSWQDIERLVREAGRRLDLDKVYGDIMSRPVSELIADICRDLGLSPDWPALAEERWAREEIASGQPGAPLANLPPLGEVSARPQAGTTKGAKHGAFAEPAAADLRAVAPYPGLRPASPDRRVTVVPAPPPEGEDLDDSA
jgi:hypothetical protein